MIRARKLSSVASGPEAAFRQVEPLIKAFAPGGVSYVGEGELARVCKIAHNVMLGVVIENLIEITLLCNKMGVPRHAFLAFLNNSAMGSMFTRYKSPALVNLDWTTTFTPELLRKDLDLGLELGREQEVPMPVTAAAREMLQSHIGAARLRPDADKVLAADFAALAETMARAAGMTAREREQARPDGIGVTRRCLILRVRHRSSNRTWRDGVRPGGSDTARSLRLHQLEPVDVEQAEVRDLEVRDHRQRQERDLQERLGQRAAELPGRRAQQDQGVAHRLERRRSHQSGNRQRQLGPHRAACDHHEAALQGDQPVDRDGHVARRPRRPRRCCGCRGRPRRRWRRAAVRSR